MPEGWDKALGHLVHCTRAWVIESRNDKLRILGFARACPLSASRSAAARQCRNASSRTITVEPNSPLNPFYRADLAGRGSRDRHQSPLLGTVPPNALTRREGGTVPLRDPGISQIKR